MENAPKFAGSRPRAKTFKLNWPIVWGGKEYHTISITRLTAGDVAKFQNQLEALLKDTPDATLRFPMFRDEAGEKIPDEVMDALDDDDKWELDKAAADFLPQRFRALAEVVTGPDTGANTGPTSEK